ncbi:MAG: hypothetical protein ACO1Q7_12510 [Gemmatimonas sp.]
MTEQEEKAAATQALNLCFAAFGKPTEWTGFSALEAEPKKYLIRSYWTYVHATEAQEIVA